jgi:hypothetical protein
MKSVFRAIYSKLTIIEVNIIELEVLWDGQIIAFYYPIAD